MLQLSEDFWNIRGSFRIAGLIDVGTHASLLRRRSGGYLLLDSLVPDPDSAAAINELTDGGEAVEAILNLHPFHTVHCEAVHALFPGAKLFGTQRHKDNLPDLPWEALTTDSEALHGRFAEDLAFSVPDGVDFISANENVHFASVLAFHHPSGTLHVDDTFNYLPPKGLLRLTPLADTVSFHPTLGKALRKEAGAAAAFSAWASDLFEHWRDATRLCAAHNGVLETGPGSRHSLIQRLENALERVEDTLGKHELRYS